LILFSEVEEPFTDAKVDVALVPVDALNIEEDAALEVVDDEDWDSFCPCPLPFPFEALFVVIIIDIRLLPPPPPAPRVVLPNLSGSGAALLD
jgi:hypothetical protein